MEGIGWAQLSYGDGDNKRSCTIQPSLYNLSLSFGNIAAFSTIITVTLCGACGLVLTLASYMAEGILVNSITFIK